MEITGYLQGRRSGKDRRQRQGAFLFRDHERRLGLHRGTAETKPTNNNTMLEIGEADSAP